MRAKASAPLAHDLKAYLVSGSGSARTTIGPATAKVDGTTTLLTISLKASAKRTLAKRSAQPLTLHVVTVGADGKTEWSSAGCSQAWRGRGARSLGSYRPPASCPRPRRVRACLLRACAPPSAVSIFADPALLCHQEKACALSGRTSDGTLARAETGRCPEGAMPSGPLGRS